MELIDWRELYAANRAVIEGRRTPSTPPRTRTLTRDRLRGGAAGAAGGPDRLVETGEPVRPPVRVHVPPDADRATARPLVVALHGCTQTAATFAAGALLDPEADRHGFVVAYPEQTREHNPQGCWNWFAGEHQTRAGGEPAFIARAARAVAAGGADWTIDPGRIFVVGMSAGGAMAGILAATHPDLFAGLAVHSGLAFGAARTLPAALQAMARGGPDPAALAQAAHRAMGAEARPVPTLVVHGTDDTVVHPHNGEHVARQWLATNRLAVGDTRPGSDGPDAVVRDDAAGRLPVVRRTWTDRSGRPLVEHHAVEGLGHAWSGGARGGSYTDPRGPSASAAIWDFFAQVGAATPPLLSA
jgi:poly(hydroxyalkanoate) depolymerase family esterase